MKVKEEGDRVMELSIGEVAARTGVSARTLRHYDGIGLFRPSHVGENGYRWYDRSSLPRLYRIVALRRAGLGLSEIDRIVDDRTTETASLREHLVALRTDHARLGELIASIEGHIHRLDQVVSEDEVEDHPREREAFSRRLADRFGPEAAAGVADPDVSTADLQHSAAEDTVLLRRFLTPMVAGTSLEAPEVLDMVAEHHAAVSRYWEPTPEAYRSLGRLYRTDPLQHAIVAEFHPDLPRWLASAIDVYVDTRLRHPDRAD